MAPPKLTYFPIKGLAEPIRFIFAYANEEFIDDRIDANNWPTIKPSKIFFFFFFFFFNLRVIDLVYIEITLCLLFYLHWFF